MGRAEVRAEAVAPLGTARSASAEVAGQRRPPPASAHSGGRGRGAGSGGRGRGLGGRGRGGGRHKVSGSEVAYGPTEELVPEDVDVQEVQLWRGITGQIFTTIKCKPSTTVLQAKEAVVALTGVPLEQQRLLSFGSKDVLTDEALVCTECISACGGLQIMIDEARPRRTWEESSSEADSSSTSEEQKSEAAAADHGGLDGPSAQKTEEGGLETGADVAGAVRAGGRGQGGRPAAARSAGGPAKLQHHLVLARELQTPRFDVLRRVAPRAKRIWQDTEVSLRLHGPGICGAGRHEEETELILSLSSKGRGATTARFREAVAKAEELVRGLHEQLRRFCDQRRLPAPGDLALQSVPGYRQGSRRR